MDPSRRPPPSGLTARLPLRWRAAVCLALLVGLAGRRVEAQGCTTPPVFAGLASATSANQSTCGISLAWAAATPSCGGTITYKVYRSTALGFVPGDGNLVATGVTGTSFLDTGELAPATTYEYVVRAVENAASTIANTNTVRRRAKTRGPMVATYFDDFDGSRPANASAYWLPVAGVASINLVTCHHHSPVGAYRIGAVGTACGTPQSQLFYPPNLNAQLVLGGDGSVAGIAGFDLTSMVGATLSFRMRHSLEDGYDFLNLFYSTTSAAGPWTPEPMQSWTAFDAPADGGWTLHTFDLDGLTGGKVWFLFQMLTDSIVQYPDGVYLDDVRVETSAAACVPLGEPVALVFGIQPSAVTAGAAVAPAVTVRVVDAQGATVPAAMNPVSLALATNPAAGTLSGTTTVAASGGVATFADLSIDRAGGGYTLAATSPGLTGATSGAFAIVPAAPHHLAVVQQPSSIVAGEPFAPPVAIEVFDAFGNRTPSVVGLALGANPALGSLLGTPWQSAPAGLATFSDLSVDSAGSGYTLLATAPGAAELTTTAFAVAPGAPHHAEFVQEPTDSLAGHPMSPPVSVAVRDAYDNLCTSYSGPLSLRLLDNPGGAILKGETTSAAGGMASFPLLSLDNPGVGYTLYGGASGLVGAASASFDVRAVVIFGDGFENGTSAAWSEAEPEPLVASLLAEPRDQVALGGELTPDLLARFTEAARALLIATGPDGKPLARVEARRAARGGGHELRAVAADGARERSTGWIALDAAADSSAVELEWWRAIGGAPNGRLVLFVDGRELAVLDGLADPGSGADAVWAPQLRVRPVPP